MTEVSPEILPSRCVFEHEKRREWGLGIIAWEDKQKRGYLFENGQLRILAAEFYPLMREVDCPSDEVQALYASLERELKAMGVEGKLPSAGLHHAHVPMSFDDQLAVFRAEYSDGFRDPRWERAQRGTGAKKRLGSHRDSALAHAGSKLERAELAARIAQQQFRPISEDIIAVLRSTDLVPAAELAALESMDSARRPLGCAVAELLYGNAVFAMRFDHFLSAFEHAYGRPASWRLATALPALIFPTEHIHVHPSIIRQQSKWMAPRLGLPNLPTSGSYLRAQSMAKLVFRRLIEHAESPRDLLDVHDFMRITTRSAAKKLLLSLNSRPRGRAPAASAP